MTIIKCNNSIPLTTQVNRVGKYIYKNLDGAFDFKKSANTFDVYTTLLYELKEEYGGVKNDVQEITINISITTYQDKLRVNTIELTPMKRTLGFDLFKTKDLDDLKSAMQIILAKVIKRIEKAYTNYKILY